MFVLEEAEERQRIMGVVVLGRAATEEGDVGNDGAPTLARRGNVSSILLSSCLIDLTETLLPLSRPDRGRPTETWLVGPSGSAI
jgi:hypothetical protein